VCVGDSSVLENDDVVGDADADDRDNLSDDMTTTSADKSLSHVDGAHQLHHHYQQQQQPAESPHNDESLNSTGESLPDCRTTAH